MPQRSRQPTVVACPGCHVSHFPPGGPLSDGNYQSACRSCGHLFKFRSVVQPKAHITVTVNNQQHTVNENYESSMSLNEFIREVIGLKGTKVMCNEGGCGCCVVAASRYDPVTSTDITLAINSCLCPLWICDGWEITTTEGIGSARQGYNDIQSRLAENCGSQCGWCSPGMVMNMYSLLQEDPMPTKQKIEDSFDGNLCRCTGYRPILETMKSFAVDIEDIGKTCCKKGGQGCHAKPPELSHPEPLYMMLRNGAQWMRPGSLPELYQLLDIYRNDKYTMVFGNTSTGVYKDERTFDVFIDVRGVSELYTHSLTGPLMFGANVTLTQLADLLEQAATSLSEYTYCANHAIHIRKIAGTPIRNAGCWAGNIMMKHAHKDFPSDVFIVMETVNAQITVGSSAGTTDYSPLELLSVNMKGKVIIKMTLPPLSHMDVVRSFKIMQRSQNAYAMVNAGFHMKLDETDNYKVLQHPSIVFGGLGDKQNHASGTEDYLLDKQLGDPSVLAVLYSITFSPNPDLDIGQVEGAFAMGLGYSLYEKTRYHPTTGQNLTNGTWEYKPPSSKDIPVDFRISLLKNKPNPFGVLGSKAIGEPPMCGSCSAWFAVKHCAEAARKETEQYNYFRMDCPATMEDAQLACLNDISHFVLQ